MIFEELARSSQDLLVDSHWLGEPQWPVVCSKPNGESEEEGGTGGKRA